MGVTTPDRRASMPARLLHRRTRGTTHHPTHAHPSVAPDRTRCTGNAQSP
jgi:hypothetical protein